MNLNRVIIIGRLAADPEVRTTQSGQQVATIRVATNRNWTDKNGQRQENVEFHTIVAWGRLADIAGQYLAKGGLAMFEGRLQTRNWTGQDNVKRYTTEIVAENLQLGPRSANAGAGTRPAGYDPRESIQPGPSTKPAPTSQENDFDDIPVIGQDEPIISDKEIEDEKAINPDDIPF
ncbi:MAG: single-stranded DNA-binding protein [Candidatus Yanofskybacteria bacterium CG10_big_fil_rev_8_21_14_0_10_46_23]|uniref:Single-stranded DNA-binding protein n=1 Tax=Candidatus Yanofskybacteria bacterium CG10_big_fil_rev_8_21_14_0_10_46_23 TaxID=1975098 RepID=A0A2H0R508_9BACT|nr:MAG: single-stranded DNA-binding protein [Candidatus Yanofskybacteria bacterium CG10_big_fil_rev_8_21_14_0_10_46_23]